MRISIVGARRVLYAFNNTEASRSCTHLIIQIVHYKSLQGNMLKKIWKKNFEAVTNLQKPNIWKKDIQKYKT